MKRIPRLVFTLFYPLSGLFFQLSAEAQMITGTWHGRINRQKVEVKIIQKGDSLTGTSYYYESVNNYRRYAIKGYFDPATNAAVWWDDQLLAEKSGKLSISIPGKVPLLSTADFNCPGGGKMMLDGKAALRDDETVARGEVHLNKSGDPEFEDEWDFVIDNYTIGANDPQLIDSIGAVALVPISGPVNTRNPAAEENNVVTIFVPGPPKEPVEKKTPPKEALPKTAAPDLKPAEPVKAPPIQEKFATRQKVFIKEIPLAGDSLELRFYDNAEIDGDSISLFLNGKLIFEHIRLTAKAYTIKLPVLEMPDSNELTMVAENMGAIPPNTSYMVAIVNNERYDAYLSSTEGSSAMIRFVKKK